MAVIDFRIRPPFRGFRDLVMYAQPERRDRFTGNLGLKPAPSAGQLSMELLLKEMDAAGVDQGVVVGRYSGFLGSVSNEDVKAVVDAHPTRFIGIASIDPRDRRKAVATIDQAIKDGFKGVNIEPGSYPEPMHTDDRRLYPIYAHCEDKGLPVLMMTGGNAGPDIEYTNPVHLDRVLADFPTLKICSTHGNWPWVHQILHLAFRRPNLYVSPDMYLVNMPGMDDYVKAADGFLADRFLYGSSYPFAPVDGYMEWFKKLPIRAESQKKILTQNAQRFLGL